MQRDNQVPYLSWRIWAIYALLIATVIPWYWRLLPLDPAQLWLGVPAWALVAIAGSAVVSTFTAWLLLRRPWPQEDELGREEDAR